MKARFSYALLSGQGYDTSFIDELLPQLAERTPPPGQVAFLLERKARSCG